MRHQHVARFAFVDLLAGNEAAAGRQHGARRRHAYRSAADRAQFAVVADRPQPVGGDGEGQQRDRQVDEGRVHLFEADHVLHSTFFGIAHGAASRTPGQW